jgi:predicted component of type VI protein secretion system
MDELQEMREQLAALKEKMNAQEMVNDRLIRDILIKKKKV